MAPHRSYSYTYCNYPNKNIDINKYALEKARLPRSVVFFFIFLQAPPGSAILNLQRGSHDISPIQQPWFSGNKRHSPYTNHYLLFCGGLRFSLVSLWMLDDMYWTKRYLGSGLQQETTKRNTRIQPNCFWPLKKHDKQIQQPVKQKTHSFPKLSWNISDFPI